MTTTNVLPGRKKAIAILEQPCRPLPCRLVTLYQVRTKRDGRWSDAGSPHASAEDAVRAAALALDDGCDAVAVVRMTELA